MTAVPLLVQVGVAGIPQGVELAGSFIEKPLLPDLWCNIGFQLVESSVVGARCLDDGTNWEADVLPVLAANGELGVHRHTGFWRSMDYPHEHQDLNRMWETGGSSWRRKA